MHQGKQMCQRFMDGINNMEVRILTNISIYRITKEFSIIVGLQETLIVSTYLLVMVRLCTLQIA